MSQSEHITNHSLEELPDKCKFEVGSNSSHLNWNTCESNCSRPILHEHELELNSLQGVWKLDIKPFDLPT